MVLSPLIILAVAYNKIESACDCLLSFSVIVKENFLQSQSWPECIAIIIICRKGKEKKGNPLLPTEP